MLAALTRSAATLVPGLSGLGAPCHRRFWQPLRGDSNLSTAGLGHCGAQGRHRRHRRSCHASGPGAFPGPGPSAPSAHGPSRSAPRSRWPASPDTTASRSATARTWRPCSGRAGHCSTGSIRHDHHFAWRIGQAVQRRPAWPPVWKIRILRACRYLRADPALDDIRQVPRPPAIGTWT